LQEHLVLSGRGAARVPYSCSWAWILVWIKIQCPPRYQRSFDRNVATWLPKWMCHGPKDGDLEWLFAFFPILWSSLLRHLFKKHLGVSWNHPKSSK
jgi:hypothetical protein